MIRHLAMLLAIGLTITGLAGRADAAPIALDPNPTDSFAVDVSVPANDIGQSTYEFTLTRPADLTYAIPSASGAILTLSLFDSGLGPTNLITNPAANTVYNLAANTVYVFVASLNTTGATSPASTHGTVTLTATPIPPAILLFLTAIAGLGGLAWHRSRLSA